MSVTECVRGDYLLKSSCSQEAYSSGSTAYAAASPTSTVRSSVEPTGGL